MDTKRKEDARLIESDRPMKKYSRFSRNMILKKEKCSSDRVRSSKEIIFVSREVRY